jgi:hypothetical protein
MQQCRPRAPARDHRGTWSARNLPILPWWLSGLAGPPPAPAAVTMTGHGAAHAEARLRGIAGRLLAARRGERNRLLFWASLRAGELVADGDLDARTAAPALTDAAAQIGLAGEDGPRAVAATIRSGFHRAGAAYEPPDHPPETTGRSGRHAPPATPPSRLYDSGASCVQHDRACPASSTSRATTLDGN